MEGTELMHQLFIDDPMYNMMMAKKIEEETEEEYCKLKAVETK